LRTPRYLREVRAALERVRPHVVHANTLLSLPEAAVARSCGLPVVLQAHELPTAGAKTTATIRYAAGIADVLVAVSDAVAQLLRRHAGRTPVFTVRNGVPTSATQARTDGTPFTVGTVATVSRTKGTDLFLRAARLSLDERPGLRFEHAGSPDLHRDSGFDAELAVLTSEIPESGALTMLGYRPAEEVLPRFDVYVCSSRSEAFPLATLEAMARGIPVVAATVGGIPEQIDHLQTGVLVRRDDAEAIATWLVRLHDDPELRARLGAAGAERVRSDFTVEAQAKGLHHAYLVALNRRFAPARVRRAAAGAA
jgi:glycosyltransferase involved in cell wall biosynthesis